jgi:hypothetical protein
VGHRTVSLPVVPLPAHSVVCGCCPHSKVVRNDGTGSSVMVKWYLVCMWVYDIQVTSPDCCRLFIDRHVPFCCRTRRNTSSIVKSGFLESRELAACR